MDHIFLDDISLKNQVYELKLALEKKSKQIEKLIKKNANLSYALAESNQEKIEAYDFNSSIYFTLDRDLIIQALNFQAAFLLDIERKFLINKLFLNFITSDSQPIFKKTIQSLFDQQLKQTCEIDILQPGGSRRTVMLESTLTKNNLIQLSLIDISSNRQLLQHIKDLKYSFNYLDEIIENANFAVAAFDSNLNANVMNTSFSDVFTDVFFTKIEVGMNLNDVLDSDHDLKQDIISACGEALLGRNMSVEIENKNNNQKAYFCYELSINSFYNQHTFKIGLLIRIRNITAYKLQEIQRHRQQAGIGLANNINIMDGMASALAHELNQPLTAIIAYSRSCLFVIDNKLKDKEIENTLLVPLEEIARQAEHAGEIIHSMKNLVRQDNFLLEETNINVLIKDAISILNYELLDSKLKITLNLLENIPNARLNKTQIIQVVLNLARNSIEAFQYKSIDKPELIIKTSALDGYLVVDFCDNGPGIPVEHHHKVLNTYFTTKTRGTGIGLNICKSLIEEHGGTLTFQPQKTAGACFNFKLPINGCDANARN